MKSLFILTCLALNLIACEVGNLSYKSNSLTADTDSGTSRDKTLCAQKDFKHKSAHQVTSLSPAETMEEELKEHLFHMPANAEDSYEDLLVEKVRKDGIKVLPVLTDFADRYDPKRQSRCNRMQLFVAFKTATDLDNTVVRLRGTSEGETTIKALDSVLERMRQAGFDKRGHEEFDDYSSYFGDLERLRNSNLKDGLIQDTLRIKHSVQMSDDELREFSSFLVTLDPKYPSWSRIESATPPLVLKDSQKFYEAYTQFSK